jgi:3-oxoacyl-[acyl-carrier protein] reductase
MSSLPAAFDLSGRVALVTGAQRGIGAECARALAAAGAQVVVGFVVEPERADALCKQIIAAGGKAYCTPFDVTSSIQVTEACEKIAQLFGRLDILVNNAGRRIDNLALKMSDEQWRQGLQVNLDGVFYCCRAALALMRKGGGSIINVSSVAAFAGSVGQANYAAAKAGIVGLTRSLALEYGGRGIRVNCVVPGIIDTEMTADLKPAFRTEMLERIPLKRFGEAADIAQAVLFLASDAAAYITGASLHVNGGGYLG